MREIRISYNPVTKELLLEDRPGTKKYIGYFKNPSELYDFFSKTDVGQQYVKRHNLHIIIDLEGITDETKISEVKKTIDSIEWNKAELHYK